MCDPFHFAGRSRMGQLKGKESPAHFQWGQQFFRGVGTVGLKGQRGLGFAVSHPSDKNKDVARVGHPGVGGWVGLKKTKTAGVRGLPP
jgi:hypothetical protein